jgi:hypothetical protein
LRALFGARALHDRAFAELAAEHAHHRHLATVRAVDGLHHVGGRLGVLELEALGRAVDERRLVP